MKGKYPIHVLDSMSHSCIKELIGRGEVIVESFEDIVVLSSILDDETIDRLAREQISTVRSFDEIMYLIDHLSSDTINRLVERHIGKIRDIQELSVAKPYLSQDMYERAYRYLQNRQVTGCRGN